MLIDPEDSSTPFACIRDASNFGEENEILFSMHSVFRIVEVQKLENKNPLYQVDLKLTSDSDEQLHHLTKRIREEVSGPTVWTR
ncbi:unnamed protein product [Rotaria magnacalcarata]|nr:unnamed protein product [Rotaria magnacalcarata]